MGDALREKGHCVAFAHVRSIDWKSAYDVAVFLRPSFDKHLVWAVSRFRWRKTQLVADFDDLIFRPSFAEYSPAVLSGKLTLEQVRRQFVRFKRGLALFDKVTVSTEPLMRHVEAQFPSAQVLVLPNAVPHVWRSLREEEVDTSVLSHRFITYFPGTATHDRDFALFARPLSEFLHASPDVRLSITGVLNFSLDVPKSQVIRHARVPYSHYHQYVRQSWVNLAPLENTPFTRCKSAVKVLESAYWGAPTLCSPIHDARRLQGAGAVVVNSEQDVHDVLCRMAEQPFHKERCIRMLRHRVSSVADVDDMAEMLLFFLDAI